MYTQTLHAPRFRSTGLRPAPCRPVPSPTTAAFAPVHAGSTATHSSHVRRPAEDRTGTARDWRDAYACTSPRAQSELDSAEERSLASAMAGLCLGWFVAGPAGGLCGLVAGAWFGAR